MAFNVGPMWDRNMGGGAASHDSVASDSSDNTTTSCDDRLVRSVKRSHGAVVTMSVLLAIAIVVVIIYIVIRNRNSLSSQRVPDPAPAMTPSKGTSISMTTLASHSVSGFTIDMVINNHKVGTASMVKSSSIAGGEGGIVLPTRSEANKITGCPFTVMQPAASGSTLWSWKPVNAPSGLTLPPSISGAPSKNILLGMITTTVGGATMYMAGFTGAGARITLSTTPTYVVLMEQTTGSMFLGFPAQNIQAQCMTSPVPMSAAWASAFQAGPAALTGSQPKLAPTGFVFRGA